MSDDDLVTQVEAARLIDRSVKTIHCWVKQGKLVAVGKKLNSNGLPSNAYRRADVLALDEQTPRSEYPREDPTAEELEALVAEQLANAPDWFHRDALARRERECAPLLEKQYIRRSMKLKHGSVS